MRKNLLALCAAAAVSGIAGNAVAMQANVAGGAAAVVVVNNNNHIGHNLVLPYFTAQGDNATLISLTNNDLTNGKAVKVRFRGAANSDDVLDFSVYLSPGDIWTAAVSKNADGLAQLRTDDNSCTQPNIKGQNIPFSTLRTDSGVTAGTARNAQTLEGYVEFITMANIPPTHVGATGALAASGSIPALAAAAAGATNPLFTATKHVSGTAPCTAATFQQLERNPANNGEANSVGLYVPTAAISANGIILNTKNTTAWSGPATALIGLDVVGGTAQTGNLVFWPQLATNVEAGSIAAIGNFTADPLLIQGAGSAVGTANLQYPQWLDLPDLSTPIGTAASATAQAIEISGRLAATRIRNEFITSSAVAAATDWLFSMPTRRFATVYNYGTARMIQNGSNVEYFNAGTVAAATTVVNGAGAAAPTNLGLSATADDATLGRRICVTGLAPLGQNTVFDREETTPTATPGAVVVSPAPVGTAAATVSLCGEAALMSFNNPTTQPSALLGTISRVNTTIANIADGWASFGTPSAAAAPAAGTAGLPIIGASFTRLVNGSVNYGISYPHRRQ
jgi:hypothetical protein